MLINQIFHVQRGLEDLTVLGLPEPYGRKRVRPSDYRIRMHRKARNVPTPLVILMGLHDGFRPLCIGAARATASLSICCLPCCAGLSFLARRLEIFSVPTYAS